MVVRSGNNGGREMHLRFARGSKESASFPYAPLFKMNYESEEYG
jgi:hypothetical protein